MLLTMLHLFHMRSLAHEHVFGGQKLSTLKVSPIPSSLLSRSLLRGAPDPGQAENNSLEKVVELRTGLMLIEIQNSMYGRPLTSAHLISFLLSSGRERRFPTFFHTSSSGSMPLRQVHLYDVATPLVVGPFGALSSFFYHLPSSNPTS